MNITEKQLELLIFNSILIGSSISYILLMIVYIFQRNIFYIIPTIISSLILFLFVKYYYRIIIFDIMGFKRKNIKI